MQEIWRDIEGYEGLYQVSNMRRIKSLNYRHTGKEEIKKQQKIKSGYLHVQLHKDGERKHYQVHRLVAQAFIPNPEGLPQVNHKDEDKTNNCVTNLEWCSVLYNNTYGSRMEKVVKSQGKLIICVETNTTYFSSRDAQRKTGINASNIRACARRDKYYPRARRYHWQFV